MQGPIEILKGKIQMARGKCSDALGQLLVDVSLYELS